MTPSNVWVSGRLRRGWTTQKAMDWVDLFLTDILWPQLPSKMTSQNNAATEELISFFTAS